MKYEVRAAFFRMSVRRPSARSIGTPVKKPGLIHSLVISMIERVFIPLVV